MKKKTKVKLVLGTKIMIYNNISLEIQLKINQSYRKT